MKIWALILSFFTMGTFAGVADAAEAGKESQQIIITRKDSVQPIKGPASTFTGDVDVELSVPKRGDSRMSAGLVMFKPGARSNWHIHPYGQLLIITEGEGRVQQWGEQIQAVHSGDLVWFPAGVKHWHGAAPGSLMSHYGIQEELDGSPVTWMEKVTDEQYNAK